MTEKEAQRQEVLKVRKALSEENKAVFSAAICARLWSHPAAREASVIFSYMAFAGEANLAAFHEWALSRGKTLAFPFTYQGGRMDALIPHGWEKNKFGFLAPAAENSIPVAPEDIELVLVPCVAFDREYYRLGWGGGYYDRYLPACSKAKKFAVAFEAQRVEHVADIQEWDVRVDAVATEARWY